MFENARSQIHLHLTLFCVYATQKGLNEISCQGSTLRSRLLDMTHVVKHNLINARTRIKRKKVLYQNLQNLFLFAVRVDFLPRSAKGRFGWCGGNRNPPRFLVLFRNSKKNINLASYFCIVISRAFFHTKAICFYCEVWITIPLIIFKSVTKRKILTP